MARFSAPMSPPCWQNMGELRVFTTCNKQGLSKRTFLLLQSIAVSSTIILLDAVNFSQLLLYKLSPNLLLSPKVQNSLQNFVTKQNLFYVFLKVNFYVELSLFDLESGCVINL